MSCSVGTSNQGICLPSSFGYNKFLDGLV